MRIMMDNALKRKILLGAAYAAALCVIVVYRIYQPVTAQALTQFDVFDWMGQSKSIQIFGAMPLHNLWFFPSLNALLGTIFHADLFFIYLYGGAIVTTLAVLPLAASIWALSRDHRAVLASMFLYAVMPRILGRSVMYLPESMTYLFGLTLVYFYIVLFKTRRAVWLVPIWFVTLAFVFLHQSGLNFLAFTSAVTVVYTLFFTTLGLQGRVLLSSGVAAVVGLVIAGVQPVRESLQFFITQNKQVDAAFQGEVIPYKQFLSDFERLYVFLLIVSTGIILFQFFRKIEKWQKASLAVILGIAFFYFSFLYILPNQNLYRLVPWRFYTWFSLYTIPLVGFGIGVVLKRMRLSVAMQVLAFSVLLYTQIHTTLVPDNMYTADKQVLTQIEQVKLPDGSVVITTNANYLQTKYAFVGTRISVAQADAALFRVASSLNAHTFLAGNYQKGSVYVLISQYQLRQRPSNIAYWSNSALYDMNLDIFRDTKYFKPVHSSQDVLVFQSL